MNDRREDRAVIPAITTALLAALYLVVSGSPAQAQATGADVREGTYRFEVLSPDGEAVVARGEFLLADAPLHLSRLPGELAPWARLASGLRPDEEPNVCFHFVESPEELEGRPFYGGSTPTGLSTWTQENGMVSFLVYRSPDAFQYFRVAPAEGRRDGRLEGQVLQAEHDGRGPLEWVVVSAERIGPASLEACKHLLLEGRFWPR